MKKPKPTPKKSNKETVKAAPGKPAEGPVTLAQARALAKPQAAPRRALVGEKAGVAKASPASVGIERKKLQLQRRRENQTRIRDYKATMAIMKKRGVKGLSPAPAGTPRRRAPGAAKAAPSSSPLQIFAEGDSWFDYPVPFFGGGIIPRLEDRLGVPILNLAKAGDEVRFMLGVEERRILAKQLEDGSPAGGSWDVLLFSGGGNDIVDNPMALWVRDFKPNVPPAKLIHQARYDAALALVRAGYEDLIAMRDSLSPGTHLVFHAYDFAIPDGRGICHLGPWMKPTFTLRNFPAASSAAFDVVKNMLRQFATLMLSLEKDHSGVTFINGQGTLCKIQPVTE